MSEPLDDELMDCIAQVYGKATAYLIATYLKMRKLEGELEELLEEFFEDKEMVKRFLRTLSEHSSKKKKRVSRSTSSRPP